MKVARKIIITGKVQGVWFRKSAQREAIAVRLTGIVMNRKDGCVYAEVEGEPKDVERFVVWCGKGPELAEVSKVEVLEQALKGYKNFEIKR